MMAGMFRGGRRRPTFDTVVTLIPINRTQADRLGGYIPTEFSLSEWKAPTTPAVEALKAATDFSARDRGDRGMAATTQGVIAWDCFILAGRGCRFVHLRIAPDGTVSYRQRRVAVGNYPDIIDDDPFTDGYPPSSVFHDPATTLAIERSEAARLNIIQISATASENEGKELPPVTPRASYAATVDDAAGQTFLWPTADGSAQQFRRAWTDGSAEAMTLLADVKDVAAREPVVGDVSVAVQTKSLIFAHATLAPLIAGTDALAKQWKVRIGNRDMDIVGVMSDWDPGRYIRLIAEDRR